MKKIISKSKEDTQKLAGEILNNLNGLNIILLQGELGAGKTTFAQGFLKAVGAKGPFTSPTFVVIKRYALSSKLKNQKSKLQLKIKNLNKNSNYSTRCSLPTTHYVYHIDAYRVNAKDMLELGWEEIIKNKNNLVLVEWPERIKDILPEKHIKLDFEMKDGDKREIKIFN